MSEDSFNEEIDKYLDELDQYKTNTMLSDSNQSKATLVEFPLNSTLPKQYKKSHLAIFSIHDQSPHEINLFTIMASKMQAEHWDNGKTPKYEFQASELSTWLDIESRYIGSTLKGPAERLASRHVGFANPEDDGDFSFVPLFSKLEYKKRVLTMIPNPELKNFMLDYSGGYGLINTFSSLKLTGKYSKRIYDFLSRFKSNGTILRPMKLDTLRRYFSVIDRGGNYTAGNTSLQKPAVFISRCIEPAIKEIANTFENEIFFFKGEAGHLGYTPIKEGNKCVGIKFHYQWIENKAKMDDATARKTISELEQQRLVKNIPLTIPQLELLSQAYLKLGQRDTAIELMKAVQDKILAEDDKERKIETIDENQSLLEKIAKLKEINPASKY
ncbi:replication initiation protein [Shewanella aestuarii]|uniref:RepB family plasmid replication initiator protein n=1 Tax=Shewanella aestuarii TaxID=1028752 RepID=A0A6G9QPP9_9GAMM|nr:replication initiation protein [Shewanella aestuarii]QIR16452.1 RepB family plasmid replication initiator protein [Shewanella aestuarii]